MSEYLTEELNEELKAFYQQEDNDGKTLETDYQEWLLANDHKYSQMVTIASDPFEAPEGGVTIAKFDYSLSEDEALADSINRAVFYLQTVVKRKRDICERLYFRRIKDDVVDKIILEHYLETTGFNGDNAVCDVISQYAAMGMVVWNSTTTVDAVAWYDLADALAEGYAIEDIYINYKLWHIIGEKRYLKKVLQAADKYIVNYLTAMVHPHAIAKVEEPIKNRKTIERLALLMSKILMVTEGAKMVYKNAQKYGDWSKEDFVQEIDDDVLLTKTTSFFGLLMARMYYYDKDEEYVKNRVLLLSSYRALCKANDLIQILVSIAEELNGLSENELDAYYASKKDAEDLYSLALMAGDEYQALVYQNVEVLKDKRRRLNLSKADFAKSSEEILHEQKAKYEAVIADQSKKHRGEISDIVDSTLELTKGFIEDDLESLMRARSEYLIRIQPYATELQIRKMEDFIYQLADKIEKKTTGESDYSRQCERVAEDLSRYAGKLFKYPSILNTLVSAEILYNEFIVMKPEREGFDYSCISIMYYLALEEFANKVLYIPYKEKVLDNHLSEINRSRQYLDRPDSYFRGARLKTSCELGPISHLLISASKVQCFKAFLISEFGVTEDRIKEITQYGKKLLDGSRNRNHAAHGGESVSYSSACNDKKIVYPEDVEEARGLLKELLGLLWA